MQRYIYLIRHGETEYGREKVYLGHTDCSLSQNGVLDAKKLNLIFNNENIKHLYSSDLKRCIDTMNIIFPHRKIVCLKELREIDMGIWDGLTFKEVMREYKNDYIKRGENIETFAPFKGESFKKCQERAVEVLLKIIKNTDESIVICTHAGFIRALMCSLLNMSLKDIFNIKQDYGCINILKIQDENIKVEKVNVKSIN